MCPSMGRIRNINGERSKLQSGSRLLSKGKSIQTFSYKTKLIVFKGLETRA
jgi:hypothetical protein